MSTDLIQQRQAIIDGVLSGNADQFLEQWGKVLPEKEYPVYVPVPQEKNNADLAIERAQAKLADKKATAGVAEPSAPPTNAQHAAYWCHRAGTRDLVPLITDFLNRLDVLEGSNMALAHRLADLELAAHTRRKTT